MRPAVSVILLTTLLGAGQGLFLAMVTHQTYALFGVLSPGGSRGLYGPAAAVSLALLLAGLVASFFHLGRPERAWRSAAMWRTSWLSREVIVLPALMGAVFLYAAAHLAGLNPVLARLPGGVAIDASMAIGAVGAALAFALFRAFDIAKPWPIREIDHGMGGGAGIMLDDVMAGILAAAGLLLLRYVT